MAEKKPKLTIEPESAGAPTDGGPIPAQNVKVEPGPDATDSGASSTFEQPTSDNPLKGATSWVRRTFPGHEHAFYGGIAGLLIAILIFTLGLFQTIAIVLLIVAGVAVGQVIDGDPKIIKAVRSLFEPRSY